MNFHRLGHTKVFFRAGVLGALEDMRDERLSKILSLFQAHVRGYIMRRSYQKLQDQRWEFLLSFYLEITIPDVWDPSI